MTYFLYVQAGCVQHRVIDESRFAKVVYQLNPIHLILDYALSTKAIKAKLNQRMIDADHESTGDS